MGVALLIFQKVGKVHVRVLKRVLMQRLQLEQIVLESMRRSSQAQMDYLTSIFNKLSLMTSVLIYKKQICSWLHAAMLGWSLKSLQKNKADSRILDFIKRSR